MQISLVWNFSSQLIQYLIIVFLWKIRNLGILYTGLRFWVEAWKLKSNIVIRDQTKYADKKKKKE